MNMHGQCLCGTVKFSVQAPTKWCAHCHCTLCQRAHGAAFVTWVGVEKSQWQIDSGTKSLRWYTSSSPAQRGFCSNCGSTLFFKSTQWPDEMHIALANMVDAIDRQPSAHAYYETHVSWLKINDSLKKVSS